MSEDRYEKVLFNIIEHHEKEISKAKRKIDRLKLRSSDHPEWSDTNLTIIETTRDMIKEWQIKIDTIWVCISHYRALL